MLKDYDGKFSVDDFTAYVRNNDFARTNQFEVFIPGMLDGPEVMLCESASIPGISILTKGVKYSGPAYQRGLSIDYGGAGIVMTFYVDASSIILQRFYYWIHKVVSEKYIVNYDSDYKRDIYISLLRKDGINQPADVIQQADGKLVDSAGKKVQTKRIAPAIYGIKIYDAFPISISPIMLDSTSDSTPARLTVTFAYRKWEQDILPEPKSAPEQYEEAVAAGYTPPPSQTVNNALGLSGSLGFPPSPVAASVPVPATPPQRTTDFQSGMGGVSFGQ